MLEPQYARDVEILNGMTPERRAEFEAWIAELEKLNEADDRYQSPMSQSIGLEGWFGYFDDGYSAADAWAEDGTYAYD